MLSNAYLLAKFLFDTAENERNFAEKTFRQIQRERSNGPFALNEAFAVELRRSTFTRERGVGYSVWILRCLHWMHYIVRRKLEVINETLVIFLSSESSLIFHVFLQPAHFQKYLCCTHKACLSPSEPKEFCAGNTQSLFWKVHNPCCGKTKSLLCQDKISAVTRPDSCCGRTGCVLWQDKGSVVSR